MLQKLFLLLVLLLLTSCTKKEISIPSIQGKEGIDIYHGKEIRDPYRNLENLTDSTVINWLQTQGHIADSVIQTIPNRDTLIQWQKEFDTQQVATTWGETITENGRYFYAKKNKGEEKYNIYFRTQYQAKEELLFSITAYEKDLQGTYHIDYFKPDWKGEKVAISIAKEGEEVSTIITLDVQTKEIFPEKITNSIAAATGGVQWVSTSDGFIYMSCPVLTPQHPDYLLNTSAVLYTFSKGLKHQKVLFSKKNNPALHLKPEDFPIISHISSQAPIVLGKVEGSSLFSDTYYKQVADLQQPDIPWKSLYKQADKIKKIALNHTNSEFIFLTAKKASNYTICTTSLATPDFDNATTLVPASEDQVIDDFAITQDGIYFVKTKNGVEAKLYFLHKGKEQEIKLPKPAGRISLRTKGANQQYLRVYIGGWLNNYDAYEYVLKTNSFTPVPIVPSIKNEEIAQLSVKNIEVSSHDGAQIPVSIIYSGALIKNSKNHTLFYGYGSYGGGIKPFYSPGFLLWAIKGGVLVIAHVRGGGEKGEQWHKGGFKTTKPNTWKDMIAVTEYAIKDGITTPATSAIWGSSAGGIMAGRAMTERPDLYNAVILTSPALNMLRSEVQPNGQNSIKEFGTVHIQEQFEALLEMDSYHHIKNGENYPATLVTGGMKDGRVVIWDPAKFVARLQAENGSHQPVLFDVDFDLGHTAINSSSLKGYEFYANPMAFALWQIGHPAYQPK